jgi:hypothetical protein
VQEVLDRGASGFAFARGDRAELRAQPEAVDDMLDARRLQVGGHTPYFMNPLRKRHPGGCSL